jgi:hypothetical protein
MIQNVEWPSEGRSILVRVEECPYIKDYIRNEHVMKPTFLVIFYNKVATNGNKTWRNMKPFGAILRST